MVMDERKGNIHDTVARAGGYPDAATENLHKISKSLEKAEKERNEKPSITTHAQAEVIVFMIAMAIITLYLITEYDFTLKQVSFGWIGLSLIALFVYSVIDCINNDKSVWYAPVAFITYIITCILILGTLAAVLYYIPLLIYTLHGGFWGVIFGIASIPITGGAAGYLGYRMLIQVTETESTQPTQPAQQTKSDYIASFNNRAVSMAKRRK
jgi:hypothetical protein